jgi:hypothetical protein
VLDVELSSTHLAYESENDSAFALLVWILLTLCTNISKEKQLKLTEHYRFIQLIIKCIRKHIKQRKKITRITHLTHGYENLEFENNLPLLYSFNKEFTKSSSSSSISP